MCVAVPVHLILLSNTSKSQIFNSFQVQLLALPVDTSRKVTANLREKVFPVRFGTCSTLVQAKWKKLLQEEPFR